MSNIILMFEWLMRACRVALGKARDWERLRLQGRVRLMRSGTCRGGATPLGCDKDCGFECAGKALRKRVILRGGFGWALPWWRGRRATCWRRCRLITSREATAVKVSGSVGGTPKSREATRRLRATEAITPRATPIRMGFMPSVTTRRRMSDWEAPRAIRMPISRTRRRTV